MQRRSLSKVGQQCSVVRLLVCSGIVPIWLIWNHYGTSFTFLDKNGRAVSVGGYTPQKRRVEKVKNVTFLHLSQFVYGLCLLYLRCKVGRKIGILVVREEQWACGSVSLVIRILSKRTRLFLQWPDSHGFCLAYANSDAGTTLKRGT